MVFKNNNIEQNFSPNARIQLLKSKLACTESRDPVSHVACPRLDEVSNPLIMYHLPDENVKLTKDFCGPWTLAYNEDNKVEESHTIKSVRPLVMDIEKLGPIIFDDACQKVIIRKPKTKKKRVVLDILKKEDFHPSYYSIL